jgi:tetratricopeptide (TPR) repeat protein
MTRPEFRSALLLGLFAVSCAGPRLAVDEVLAAPQEPEAAGSRFPSVLEFDARANAAREAAARPEATLDELVDASRALFLAADARVQRAALERLDALETPTLADVLSADEGLDAGLRAEVEALAGEGLELAQRASEIAPEDQAALLYRAINTSLLAWSVGEGRALLEGLGSDCKQAIRAALQRGEEFEGAAPLRLRGRFLSKAPWPLGDKAEAVVLLRRATELAPVTLNWLFLGDALEARGEHELALDAWQRATDAPSDEGSAALGAYHREFARRRVELAPR